MKKVLSIGLAMLAFFPMSVGAKELFVDSPNGKISVTVSIDSVISWSARCADTEIIAPSEISMTFRDGEVIGRNPKLRKSTVENVDETIDAVLYKKKKVADRYNELKMQFRNYALYFRAYDDGIAYRWETNFKSKIPVVVQVEKAEFCFAGENHDVTVGYVRAERDVRFLAGFRPHSRGNAQWYKGGYYRCRFGRLSGYVFEEDGRHPIVGRFRTVCDEGSSRRS